MRRLAVVLLFLLSVCSVVPVHAAQKSVTCNSSMIKAWNPQPNTMTTQSYDLKEMATYEFTTVPLVTRPEDSVLNVLQPYATPEAIAMCQSICGFLNEQYRAKVLSGIEVHDTDNVQTTALNVRHPDVLGGIMVSMLHNISAPGTPDVGEGTSMLVSVNILVFMGLLGSLTITFILDGKHRSSAKDIIRDEEVRRLRETIARLRKESQTSPTMSPQKSSEHCTPLIRPTDEPPRTLPSFACRTVLSEDTASETDNCPTDRDATESPLPMEEWWMNPSLTLPPAQRAPGTVKTPVNTGLPSPTTPPQSFYFSHFKHKQRIGVGGCGAVFLAEHRATHLDYAIKVLRLSHNGRDRIIAEAATHATLDHVNVVRYYSSWEDTLSRDELTILELHRGMRSSVSNMSLESEVTDSTSFSDSVTTVNNFLFIQMHFYKGGALRQWLDRPDRTVDPHTNIRIFQQLVCGLLHLHSKGILHRDLKPGNIFVSQDTKNEIQVKIGDFGLSVVRERFDPEPTDPHALLTSCVENECTVGVGTPLYCSPEQLKSGRVSEASDVFSLGIVMLECYMTWATESEKHKIMESARKGFVPQETTLARFYPEEMRIILEMIRHDPNKRTPLSEVQKAVKRMGKRYSEMSNSGSGSRNGPVPSSPLLGCRTQALTNFAPSALNSDVK